MPEFDDSDFSIGQNLVDLICDPNVFEEDWKELVRGALRACSPPYKYIRWSPDTGEAETLDEERNVLCQLWIDRDHKLLWINGDAQPYHDPRDDIFEEVASAAQPLVERLVRHVSLLAGMPETLDLRGCPRLKGGLTEADIAALTLDPEHGFHLRQVGGVWFVVVEPLTEGGFEPVRSTLQVDKDQWWDLLSVMARQCGMAPDQLPGQE